MKMKIKTLTTKIKNNKLHSFVYILLIVSAIDFISPFVYSIFQTPVIQKSHEKGIADFEAKLKEYKKQLVIKEAKNLDMTPIKGATKYTKILLQNNTIIQNLKSKKIQTIKGLPDGGVVLKSFVHGGNYYFYGKKSQMFLVLSEKAEK